jgi:hypothetical protein
MEQNTSQVRDMTKDISFGFALLALEQGKKVCRPGWNGKGMFVYYVPGGNFPSLTDIAKQEFGETVTYNPYFAIKNVDGTVSTWVPCVNDCLAKDWMILD